MSSVEEKLPSGLRSTEELAELFHKTREDASRVLPPFNMVTWNPDGFWVTLKHRRLMKIQHALELLAKPQVGGLFIHESHVNEDDVASLLK